MEENKTEEPTTVTLDFTIDDDLMELLEHIAKNTDKTVNELISDCMTDEVLKMQEKMLSPEFAEEIAGTDIAPLILDASGEPVKS